MSAVAVKDGRKNMMDRRELIKKYKNSIQPMGIVQVRNIRNNRVYLTASANTPGTINSIRFQLKMGTFLPSAGLAQDWKELGEQNFVMEVLDELKPVDDPGYDYRDDLKALEEMWLEKLKPFGERGYH
ncbi:MAG: GIY-YIG nuclease family protein [Nitrospirae bacterium]|nr:GIY-YIG nuclease family protein [Nitrospirota bacterium]